MLSFSAVSVRHVVANRLFCGRPCNSPTISTAIFVHVVVGQPTGTSGADLDVLFSLLREHAQQLDTLIRTCTLTSGHHAASLTLCNVRTTPECP